MSRFDHSKYPSQPRVKMSSRRWPDNVIERAPQWCSVDLRDGNQALVEPMTAAQKLRLWKLLLSIGFKQIEIGFPAASSHDFDFTRKLIEENLIPADVTVQVLTQAREELVAKTFEALKGVPRAIVHVYNSTSTVQREKVFRLDRDGIRDIAISGAKMLVREAAKYPETQWTFQYSPESFTGTELDFAVDVCNAVIDVWQPTPQKKAIINLPATVEMTTPNVYADQVEWMCDRLDRRDSIEISLHAHNDRGCAVAASELGVLAGADRVEGTLFGNGERTGNMDIVTMAMNLYSQGIDPGLDFERMDEIITIARECTQLPVHPRHPYAGDLVFTAFSGSHQDAIRKCLNDRDQSAPWEIAYLPIDPADIGRSYEAVIRINSQSGKGGVTWVLEQDGGYQLPRWLQIDFSRAVQEFAEQTAREVRPDEVRRLFDETYLQTADTWCVGDYSLSRKGALDELQAEVSIDGISHAISGQGNGVVAAFVEALEKHVGLRLVVTEYSEHALTHSSDADAVCYVQLNINGERCCGVGQSSDIVKASMSAIVSAVALSQRRNATRAA